MASAAVLIVSTLVSAGTALNAQKSAEEAANAQSQSQQNLLERRAEDQRQALVENSKRQQDNKQRRLAQLRASQAASGFDTTSGTSLAIFGDIEGRLDEDIDESISRGLDAIGTLDNQRDSLAFSDDLRADAGGAQRLGIGINAATGFVSGARSNFQRTGNGPNPFGIFN